MGLEALDQGGEIRTGEAPVERTGRRVVALGEASEAIGQGGEISEVGGLDDFALDDREDDLDLIQPGGVDG